MYRNAVPFKEIIIEGGFFESLADLQAVCEQHNEVHNVVDDKGYRFPNESKYEDYAELSTVGMMTDHLGMRVPHNTNHVSIHYDNDHCNPCEEPREEYQHSMEMKLEEDNLDYSRQYKSIIFGEKMELEAVSQSTRSVSPSTPCWPIPDACSQSQQTYVEMSNLKSSLPPDYQELKSSTMNKVTANRNIRDNNSYPSSLSNLCFSEVNKENVSGRSSKSVSIARSIEAQDSPTQASSLKTCAQRFERAIQLTLEPDGFAEETVDEMDNTLKDIPGFTPMKEEYEAQLLQTPTRSDHYQQDHEVSDTGFSKETSASMDYSQTSPRHVLRRIPAKVFRSHNQQNEDLDESICALNYSITSDDSFNKTSDQIYFDTENLHTPRLDGLDIPYESTPVPKRLSEEPMPEEDNLDDTICDNNQTPTASGRVTVAGPSTTRRRRKRKALTLKKRHRVEPIPTLSIVKDYFNQAYDLQVSESDLVHATDGSLTMEGIKEASEARGTYLKKSTLSKTGRNNFVNFGLDYRIQTLYKSSYPPRYALLNEIYVCRSCFQYFATGEALARHQTKCNLLKMPPGPEIYRDKKNFLSIFLVQGDKESIYCSNLSLLTMFWLRDKVVYLDVEPFTYYVVARPNAEGNFLPLGYFSKQRENGENHNLCCFCVFPCFQKQGLGRFIIDFSYSLSRLEKSPGGPERPFSTLGEIAYKSYWYETLIQISADIMQDKMDNTISSIMKRTGMQESDVIETLTQMFPDNKQKKKQPRVLSLPLVDERNSIYETAQQISIKREQLKIHDEYFAPTFLESHRTF